MAHFHEDSDTYYLDQLCLIALSGAFGGVCLTLFFWQTPMLNLMLGPQFHAFVLGSGILLLGMAGIRSVILWKAAGGAKTSLPLVPDHVHEHGHEHHDPENCQHDHDHDHGHDHQHGQDHTHEHAHEGHDHDWAPWRYVVLLLPIMLFLLGLPNKGPSVHGATTPVDLTSESNGYATLVAAGDPIGRKRSAAFLSADS